MPGDQQTNALAQVPGPLPCKCRRLLSKLQIATWSDLWSALHRRHRKQALQTTFLHTHTALLQLPVHGELYEVSCSIPGFGVLGAGGAGATDASLGVLVVVGMVPPAHTPTSPRPCLPQSPVLCNLQALFHSKAACTWHTTLCRYREQRAQAIPHFMSLLSSAHFQAGERLKKGNYRQAQLSVLKQTCLIRWTALKHNVKCCVQTAQRALSLPHFNLSKGFRTAQLFVPETNLQDGEELMGQQGSTNQLQQAHVLPHLLSTEP